MLSAWSKISVFSKNCYASNSLVTNDMEKNYFLFLLCLEFMHFSHHLSERSVVISDSKT